MIIFSLRVRNDVKASDHIQSDIVRTGDHIQSDNNNNVNAGRDFQSDIVRTVMIFAKASGTPGYRFARLWVWGHTVAQTWFTRIILIHHPTHTAQV